MTTKKPLIGITCGEIQNIVEPWASITQGQSRTYIEAVIRAGGVPFIIPITEDETVQRQLYELADGILFAGGNDVDPKHYGQSAVAEIGELNPRRDAQELQLMEWTLRDDKPFLAICRGMQLLNIARGGSMYQHIPTELPAAQNHEASKRHEDTAFLAHTLKLAPDSKIAAILRVQSVRTNSQHHQAIHELGEGLTATAWAEDGIIEAIELAEKTFAIAVQSHPEGVAAQAEPTWELLFQSFVRSTTQA